MTMSVEDLLNQLRHDRNLQSEFRKLLLMEDDYAKKSDLQPILEELKAQRISFEKEMKSQRSSLETFGKELKAHRTTFEREMKSQNNTIVDLGRELVELRKEVNQFHYRLDKHENWLRKMGGNDLELLSLSWFKQC